MPNASDMKGKAAIVTGAASGLGRATALKLAQAGADVCIVDVNAEGLAETAAQIHALHGASHAGRVLTHRADLSQREACIAVVPAAIAAFGRLDALCNVAGIIVMCNAHDMPALDYERTIAINLNAPFWLTQAAIPHLLETNGAVVNVTSSAAFTMRSATSAGSSPSSALACAAPFFRMPSARITGRPHTNVSRPIGKLWMLRSVCAPQ